MALFSIIGVDGVDELREDAAIVHALQSLVTWTEHDEDVGHVDRWSNREVQAAIAGLIADVAVVARMTKRLTSRQAVANVSHGTAFMLTALIWRSAHARHPWRFFRGRRCCWCWC